MFLPAYFRCLCFIDLITKGLRHGKLPLELEREVVVLCFIDLITKGLRRRTRSSVLMNRNPLCFIDLITKGLRHFS
ncbi:hypothetical protein [Desulfobacca acetoxidans]